jgi:hypothetical protein
MSARSDKLKTELLLNNAAAIEKYTPAFVRPDVRLRFIQTVADVGNQHQANLRQSLASLPFFIQRRLTKWILNLKVRQAVCEFVREEKSLSSTERQSALRRTRVSAVGRFALMLYERNLLKTFSFAFVSCAIAITFLITFFATSQLSPRLMSKQSDTTFAAKAGPAQSNSNVNLPNLPESKEVWLVETQQDFERYSNGLRVVTTYQTTNRARKFQLYERNLEKPSTDFQDKPIGILYHSSESDLVAFVPKNTGSIQAITQDTLTYVQRNKLYNYFIDRFGQVYRIVSDDQVAFHAGRSVWSNEKGIMLELNESFIGVSFETRSGDNSEGHLTEAQLIAGRLLTGLLRSIHKIEDANCVTHGLASVNPDNMIIAYHHDWLKGFPFASIGLTDKYEQPPPSIAELGFMYDSNTINLLGGKPLPGLSKANEVFKNLAAKQNTTPDNLRTILRERYLTILKQYRSAND